MSKREKGRVGVGELLGLGSVTKLFELVMLSCTRCVFQTVVCDLCGMVAVSAPIVNDKL